MTPKYLPISKQEFVSLYRYGRLPYNINLSIPDSIHLETDLFEILKQLPFFKDDEDYLIIKFKSEDTVSSVLCIEQIDEFIPLTLAAKKSYEIKFSRAIFFSNPRFDNIAEKYFRFVNTEECRKGAVILYSLFDLDLSNNPTEWIIDIDEVYDARIEGKKSNEIGRKDFYIHLLVYDRFEIFPKTDLGYLYDIGEIFAHSKGKPSFKGSGLHTYLQENKRKLELKKLSEIFSTLEQSNEVNSFKDQLTVGNVKKYISGALFLSWKEKLADKDSIFETEVPRIIEYAINHSYHLNEAKEALFLLGSFFGYEKFYEDYYKNKNFKFINKITKPPKKEANKEAVEVDDKDLESKISSTQVKGSNDGSSQKKIGKSDPNIQIKSNDKIINSHRSILLDEVLKLVENGVVEVENKVREKLQKILKQLNDGKNPRKNEIKNILEHHFSENIGIWKLNGDKFQIGTIEQIKEKKKEEFKSEQQQELRL